MRCTLNTAVKMATLKSDDFVTRLLRATKNTALNVYTSEGCCLLGLQRHVVQLLPDVSEEHIASIFRVKK
jgi:hypothetical protein